MRKRKSKDVTSNTEMSTVAPASPSDAYLFTQIDAAFSPPVGPIEVDGNLYFSAYDLARYELAQIRVENSYLAISLKRAEAEKARHIHELTLEKAMRDYDAAIRQNNEDLAQLLGVSKNLENNLRTLQTEIAALYKIDLSKVSYDVQTGKINFQVSQ